MREPARSSGSTCCWYAYLLKGGKILAAVVGLLGIIGVLADWESATQMLRALDPLRTTLRPAKAGEVLILIADFDYTDGTTNTDADGEIYRAIRSAVKSLGLSDCRVEHHARCLKSDDRDGAEELAQRYDASMVIWGSDTGARVTVNYLNLRGPHFGAELVTVENTESTILANPKAYNRLVTTALPGALTFVSFYAISQAYTTEGCYEIAVQATEKAVDSLPEDYVPKDLADACFLWGWLCQTRTVDTPEAAILAYGKAIELDPDYYAAYLNRGNAYAEQGNLQQAICDYSKAIRIDDTCAAAYCNRGNTYSENLDYEQALQDYARAIRLDPDCTATYLFRGIVYSLQGDHRQAIEDYEQVIWRDPGLAMAYVFRGLAYAEIGDAQAAASDWAEYKRLTSENTN